MLRVAFGGDGAFLAGVLVLNEWLRLYMSSAYNLSSLEIPLICAAAYVPLTWEY